MSGFSEYDQYDALGLADLVRRKDVTPTELLDEAITRLERVDTTLNAVPLRHYDEARAQISRGLPDGPFTGVPFLLKDLGATQAGLPLYQGNRALRAADTQAPGDTPLGARFLPQAEVSRFFVGE